MEALNIRFVYPEATANPSYAQPQLAFSFLSDYTYNRVGYVAVPLDSLAELDLGDRVLLDDDTKRPILEALERHQQLGLEGNIQGLDDMAIRVLAGVRDDAILEYPRLCPIASGGSGWGCCSIRW